MRNQSLARIMYGSSQEYSLVAAASTPLAPLANLSDREDARSAQDPETIAELLSKAWAKLSRKP